MKDRLEKILGVQQKADKQGREIDFNKEEILYLPIKKICTNPYQPRRNFETEKIEELAQSIKTYGLLQPIIVSATNEGYFIVAGERRFLACKMLGWTNIPAIVRDYRESSMAAVALIENIQREDLTFMEEAQGYKRLMDEFNLTQEVLAQRLGKSQSTIANKLRLLRLPDEVKELLKDESITERHARALLRLETPQEQLSTLQIILEAGLNVKETEHLVDKLLHRDGSRKERDQAAQKKVVVRDVRIFLNTVRQAVNIIKRAGLNPKVEEKENEDYWEVRIKLPKNDSNR